MRIAFWLVALLCAVPPPIRAQDTAAARPLQLHAALARVKPATVLRLSQAGTRITGPFVRADSVSLWLEGPLGAQAISLRGVDSLWVRRRSTLRGAAIGAVALGIPLAIGGAITCGIPESDCSMRLAYAVILGGFGAAIGGTVGGTIGFFAHHWRRVTPP